MRHFKTEGIIIKRRNYGEADRILTVLTKDFGKLSIKAAGVRKITSRRSAHIELLNHSSLNLYLGKGMHVLTEVRMIEDHRLVKQDFAKVGLAYHMCELVDGLCPDNQENSTVFFLLKNALQALAKTQELISVPKPLYTEIDAYTIGTFGVQDSSGVRATGKNMLLDQFEVKLLSELGYWDKNEAISEQFDTHALIETILERKLKSHAIFAKLQ